MDNLEALIARVEGLTSPCRETDALIQIALTPDADCMIHPGGDGVGSSFGPMRAIDMEAWKRLAHGIDGAFYFNSLSAYTSQFGAARSLLPEHALGAVGDMEDGPFARICAPMPDGGFGGGYVESHAATVELALTLAALRAIASRSAKGG